MLRKLAHPHRAINKLTILGPPIRPGPADLPRPTMHPNHRPITIRSPSQAAQKFFSISQVREKLVSKFARKPTNFELSHGLNHIQSLGQVGDQII
jgi:hypothetical protein